MGRIIHLEITADDLDRATNFYATAFGWELESSPFVDGYVVAGTGEGQGIDAAIMRRAYQSQPAIAWLDVDDIDAALESVRAAGGEVVGEVQTIPTQGRVGYVRDTEGNLLGLRQPE